MTWVGCVAGVVCEVGCGDGAGGVFTGDGDGCDTSHGRGVGAWFVCQGAAISRASLAIPLASSWADPRAAFPRAPP